MRVRADERHQKKNKAIKLTDSVKNYISEKLKEYWSPEQIMGRLDIFACFTPFSCRIKEWLIYPLTD
jgi:IS30 family transposase